MKRIATLLLLVSLTWVVGCEPKKPEKVQTNAPPATAAGDETMPPADGDKPADGVDKPADGADAPADGTEKPADEAAK